MSDKITKELARTPAPFVLLGVGIPGSGKTTVLSSVAEDLQIKRICPDEIREELTGTADNQSVNSEAWSITYARAREELHNGKSVIVDATHVEAHRRMTATKQYREWGATSVLAALFMVGIETAKHRNVSRERVVPEHAVVRMHRMLQLNPPSEKEGFDKILYIDE